MSKLKCPFELAERQEDVIGNCLYCGVLMLGTASENDQPLICLLCMDPRDHFDPANDDSADTGFD